MAVFLNRLRQPPPVAKSLAESAILLGLAADREEE